MTDQERTLESLQNAQQMADKLFQGLDADPATRDTRHAAYARALVGYLITLESDLLES